MKIVDFGKRSGLRVAPVSIGAMRLPGDALDAVELIRYAIDAGMRYIDTSRGYGESEFLLSCALKDGYREKVILSTKSAPWIKKVREDDDGSADSIRRRIEESLVRLGVDYLDFYQVWNIHNAEGWENATRKGGMVEGILKARSEGLVKHLGFTTHEKPATAVNYLKQADWCEAVLVSYNLLKTEYRHVLETARELGIAAIVMNPVGGGKLTENSPIMQALVEKMGAESLPDLAIRYVLSNSNVDTILCGMSCKSDVDHSIASSRRPLFTPDQIAIIDQAIAELSRKNVGFCTDCGYCMPCPAGIDIPGVMGLIYDDRFLGLKKSARQHYGWVTRNVKPMACTRCGQCEEKCTQRLKVIKELAYAAAEYDTK